MIGANVKNKKELENIKSVEDTLTGKAATGKFGFPFADPVGPPKGELQKIIEQKEGKGKKDNQGSGTQQGDVQKQAKPIGELSDYEKNIRAREDAYLKMLAGADQRFTDRAAAAEKQGAKDKYMAVAQLGLDIMGADSSGNLFRDVAKSAKDSQVLEKVQAANQRLQKQRNDLEDKAFAAKTGLAKEELGVELNREDRANVKEAKDAEKKYKSDMLKIAKDELKLKEKEVNATIDASDVTSKDFNSMRSILGDLIGEGTNFVTTASGALTFVGKGINKEYDTLIKDAVYDAQIGLANSRSLTDFVRNRLPAIQAKITNIQTNFPDAAAGKKAEQKKPLKKGV